MKRKDLELLLIALTDRVTILEKSGARAVAPPAVPVKKAAPRKRPAPTKAVSK
jgi:hypothetical protein